MISPKTVLGKAPAKMNIQEGGRRLWHAEEQQLGQNQSYCNEKLHNVEPPTLSSTLRSREASCMQGAGLVGRLPAQLKWLPFRWVNPILEEIEPECDFAT
jgi:hypothetical protein